MNVSEQPIARRDRLRELLDAVVDAGNTGVGEMARSSYASEFHFSREVRRLTGESPAALRRRIMLERAAWRTRGRSRRRRGVVVARGVLASLPPHIRGTAVARR